VLDLQINEIETISKRDKYSSVGVVPIGPVFGIALSAVIGYSQGNDEPKIFTWSLAAKNKAIIGVVIGILPGALMGYGLRSIKVAFPPKGSMATIVDAFSYSDYTKRIIGTST
jgi:hypothetical protein